MPLGNEAFKPGFEEHHRTGNENSAQGISSGFEQGLSSQTLSKHTMSDTREHKPAKWQLPRKRHEAGKVKGPQKEASQGPLTVSFKPACNDREP